ncbi:MAG: hypothetical protein Q9200_007257 [Gallowayella weberi]
MTIANGVMISQAHRALARLSHCSTQCLDKHALTTLSFRALRAASSECSRLGVQESIGAPTATSQSLWLYRSYATDAVSRPKAHTGRTASAPRKKASTAKATTTNPAAATTDSGAKKTKAKAKPKSKPKAKPRTRAKSTKARKKTAKAKAKPAKKKKKAVVSPEEKERIKIRQLKAKALTIPRKTPSSAFQVLLAEQAKKMKVRPGQGPSPAKESSKLYRSFTPEEREHYNHLANHNKATNESKYKEWILSYTPSQIHEANVARRALRSRTSARPWPKLHDERLVTRLQNAYSRFTVQRHRSGDFAGLGIVEASKLIGAEWRALSASDKEPYLQEEQRDSARYHQEVKAVYKRDVPQHSAKAA